MERNLTESDPFRDTFGEFFGGRIIFFFFDTTVDYKHFTSVQVIFLKKYFGSLENGCIFASAFDEKRHVEKDVDN